MSCSNWAIPATAMLWAAAIPSAAPAEVTRDPLRFFEGRTESVSTVKILTKKPYRSTAKGRGEIRADGTLHLVQRVEEQGDPPKERRWQIRKVGPGRFTGNMSEAKGPVTIEEVGGRYRFRFKMAGGLSVEQWLTPTSDWKSAKSEVTVRKLGIRVGHSEGIIRKTK